LNAGRVLRGVLLAGAALGTLAACGRDPRVARVYDGKIVEGRYVSPDAYAAFLRGVLAEESGDYRGAIAAYGEALDEDESDPEIATRIAEARCKANPADPESDRWFAQALAKDPESASALAAKARCATARGRTEEAAQLAQRAAALDPSNVALAALAVRSSGDPAARERAIALTEAHAGHAAAWDALVQWGYAHKDAALVVRGLVGLVRVAPSRSGEVEKAATTLLAAGDAAQARTLAVAVADAPRELAVRGPHDPIVARLAVDEALARGDRARALARATRGHVPLAELAARALLLDQRDVALAIATSVTSADPASSGAAMVKLAIEGGGGGKGGPLRVPPALQSPGDQPPELCALVLADRLAATAGADAARTWLARIVRTPIPPRDPLATALAERLAAKGVLPAPLHAAQ
jgi:hypothetical protein